MKMSEVMVSLEPIVRMKWPNGREAVFSADDLTQLLTVLISEGLLLLDLGATGKILQDLEIDLVRDDQGRWVLRAMNYVPLADLTV